MKNLAHRAQAALANSVFVRLSRPCSCDWYSRPNGAKKRRNCTLYGYVQELQLEALIPLVRTRMFAFVRLYCFYIGHTPSLHGDEIERALQSRGRNGRVYSQ